MPLDTLVLRYSPLRAQARRRDGLDYMPGEGPVSGIRLGNQHGFIELPGYEPGQRCREIVTAVGDILARRLVLFATACQSDGAQWNQWSFLRFVLGASEGITDTRAGDVGSDEIDASGIVESAYAIDIDPALPLLGLHGDSVLFLTDDHRMFIRSATKLQQELGARLRAVRL